MQILVLLRHGESAWNKENRFTGWVDVGLTEIGVQEARRAGRALKERGLSFDLAYTSVLKRAIKTLWMVLEEMDLMWIPIHRSWRLNERHYGALQGLNKADTAERFGREQVIIWRRSYAVPPPALSENDEYYPGRDPRYASLNPDELPLTESLKDVVTRFLPYWEEVIRQRFVKASASSSLRTETVCAASSNTSIIFPMKRSSSSTSPPESRWCTSLMMICNRSGVIT